MTRADAIAYAGDGIRINCINPGYVVTPLLESATGTDVMKRELERTPMGRFANMEEIADSIVFLASPMSSYMAGACLVVDGGFTIQ
jgi:NAD(P)-dependent dehydrogenase (short-subunit alcohol dehydrogenase family)